MIRQLQVMDIPYPERLLEYWSQRDYRLLRKLSAWKRGRQYWLDAVVHGERYREPLGTTDWRQAKEFEKKRLAELLKRPPDPTKRAHKFSALPIEVAIDQYAEDRRAQVSERMVAWWKENARPLVGFFGDKPLRKVTPADLGRTRTLGEMPAAQQDDQR